VERGERDRKEKGVKGKEGAEGRKRIGKGREGSTWIFVRAAEFLVTPLIIVVHALGRHTQRYSQWAAAAMRTLATSTPPIGSIDSPLSSFVTPPLFHSTLKTFLLCKSFPPQPSFSSSGLTT